VPISEGNLDRAADSLAPLHVWIRNAIVRDIDAGILASGEQLPPLRTIAELFEVGLRTASRGIHLLQEEGRVVAVHGRGVYVAAEQSLADTPVLYLFLHPGSRSPTTHADVTRFQGVMQTAAKRNVALRTALSLDGYRPSQFTSGNVGIIFHDMYYRHDGFGWVADLAAEHRLPCCVLKRGQSEFPTVRDNRHRGFQAVAEHLAALGHRHIAMLNGPTDRERDKARVFSDDRRGYLSGLRRSAIRSTEHLYFEVPTHGDGAPDEGKVEKAVDRLLGLRRRPTAIICMNDEHALLVLELLLKKGVRVPDDMSLAGFDNIQACETAEPPLTTADGRTYEIGQVAVEYVLALLGGRRPRPPAVTPTLVERGSTAPPNS